MPFKKGDPNINRAGREKGSTNKNKVPTFNEIDTAVQRLGLKAVTELGRQLASKEVSDAAKLKAATWVLERLGKLEEFEKEAKEAKKKDKQEKAEQTEEKAGVVFSLKAVEK